LETKELYWLAGLFEGEGSTHIYHRNDPYSKAKPILTFTIGMTDEDVIRRAFDLTKYGGVYGPYNKVGKPVYVWKVNNKIQVASLLMTLYPLMGKRRQSQFRSMLRVWKSIPTKGQRKYNARLFN
jgi:hypothetical protein